MNEKIYSVLAVDDNETIGQFYTELFKFLPQYVFYFTTNPHTALDYLYSHEVHITLLDINMPQEFDGFMLASHIEEYNPQIVQIFVSANDTAENIKRALSSHMIYDFLTKPIKIHVLKDALHTASLEYERRVKLTTMQEQLTFYKRFADLSASSEIEVDQLLQSFTH